MEAIAAERQRVLLTLATRNGQNFIAFQIGGSFPERWSLSREPTRRRGFYSSRTECPWPPGLQLRFGIPEDALVRIAPDEIS